MSYINPNSDIYVLHDIPLDPTQDNTLWFANLSAQTSYFTSKAKYQFTKQTYQRVKRGYIRLQKRAEDLYDCNYLMFRNTAYGTKWFYAFLDSVDYINDSVCEIRYTIDPMQTWFFDYLLEQCLVIREHSQSDNIGDNLVPEDVNLGEYVTGMPHTTGYFTNWKIVIIATAEIDQTLGSIIPARGGYFAGVFGSAFYYVLDANTQSLATIRQMLKELAILQNTNVISAMYMLPSNMIPSDPHGFTTAVDSRTDAINRLTEYTVPFVATGGATDTLELFGGYQPKNKKLYTYPYNYFICTNNQGDTKEYKYEYFDPNVGIKFKIVCDYNTEPAALIAPDGYLQKHQTSGVHMLNLQQSLTMTNFPKCTWATNDFGAKLVQAGIGLALAAATSGVSIPATAGGFMANHYPVEPLKTDVAGYLPEMNKPATQSWVANNLPVRNVEGTPGSRIGLTPADAVAAGYIARQIFNVNNRASLGKGDTMYIIGGFDFTFKQVFLDAPFAEIVDNYFQCYGYACNKVKVPNIHVRDHWTYTRTANCSIKPYPASQQHPVGGIPADDMKQICDLFNRGIRFWVNASEVGNYYLTNDPISLT